MKAITKTSRFIEKRNNRLPAAAPKGKSGLLKVVLSELEKNNSLLRDLAALVRVQVSL